jgi:hypothetical protein
MQTAPMKRRLKCTEPSLVSITRMIFFNKSLLLKEGGRADALPRTCVAGVPEALRRCSSLVALIAKSALASPRCLLCRSTDSNVRSRWRLSKIVTKSTLVLCDD